METKDAISPVTFKDLLTGKLKVADAHSLGEQETRPDVQFLH